jgi:hypothetical protein
MQGNENDNLVFRKSSFSNGTAECVEVAVTADGGRAVRDSKNIQGPVHFYTPGEWTAFIKGVKAGEFDA